MILCELLPNGFTPQKNYRDDGGYDLFIPQGIVIHDQLTEPLGVKVLIPLGWTGRIVPRSSAYKAGVEVNGTIDRYTGELFLTIKNSKNTSIGYNRGSSIAQLVPVWTGAGLTMEMVKGNDAWAFFLSCNELDVVSKLPETQRGTKGLGSSGNTN